jgi:hypothetical protein
MFEIDLRINCKSGNLTLLELLEVVKIGYEKRQPKQKEIEIDFGGMTFLHKC